MIALAASLIGVAVGYFWVRAITRRAFRLGVELRDIADPPPIGDGLGTVRLDDDVWCPVTSLQPVNGELWVTVALSEGGPRLYGSPMWMVGPHHVCNLMPVDVPFTPATITWGFDLETDAEWISTRSEDELNGWMDDD